MDQDQALIEEKIKKLRDLCDEIKKYMKDHNLKNSDELENKLQEDSEDKIRSLYSEFKDEIQNKDQKLYELEYIKSDKLFDNYNMSEEVVDRLISLIKRENFSLIPEPKENQTFPDKKPDTKITDDYKVPPPQEDSPENYHNNFYSYVEENEILRMPDSFIKYLLFLESLNCQLLNKYKNFKEANERFKEQILIFKEAWNKFDEFFYKNKIESFDDSERLKGNLKKELFENYILIDGYNILIKLKIIIIPLDMKKLKINYEMCIIAAEKIMGENVTALFGPSNSGKSTITHYLGGSKMEQQMINGIRNIYAESIKYPELENVCISHY